MSEELDHNVGAPESEKPAKMIRRRAAGPRDKKSDERPPINAAFWFIEKCGSVQRARVVFEVAADACERLELLETPVGSKETC
jgi:hypothetical protein